MKKRKKSILSTIVGIVLLFSFSVIGGFKIAEKTETKINKVATSTNQNSETSVKTDQVGGKTDNINKNEKNKLDEKVDSNKSKQDDIKKEENKSKQTDVKKDKTTVPDGTKVAYLTFDDGPTPYITSNILGILKENDIKATFFVIGSMAEANPDLLRLEKSEGHVIANHTYSHNYKYDYSSTTNFLKDLKKGEEVVTAIIGGHNKTLIRFPGGSFGRQSYKQAVKDAGYHYVDWNCLNGDAETATASVDKLISRFKETVQGQKELTILMHDASGKSTTVQALPEIIKYLKSNGYVFKTLE